MPAARRGVTLAVALTVTVTVVGACGVPNQTSTTTITAVPYGLLQPEPDEAPAPTPSSPTRPFVYLVRDDTLVAVEARDVRRDDPAPAAVTAVLAQLSHGPSEQDRSAGLSTALGPDTAFRLAALDGRIARIDIAAGERVPASARVTLAVGQVVLSVTSVPGVDAVLMTRNGAAVEIPLPGGALTQSPVTVRDYAPLVGPTSPTNTG